MNPIITFQTNEAFKALVLDLNQKAMFHGAKKGWEQRGVIKHSSEKQGLWVKDS